MQRVFALMYDPDFLEEWSDSKQKEFDALPEDRGAIKRQQLRG